MDIPFLQALIEWINQHPGWTGLAVFLIAFVESLALIGFVMPGAVLLFAMGAVVSTGAYPLGDTVLFAILGAILGDGLSYWLGHYYKDQLTTLWPLSRHPELLVRGTLFFERHGGKSVFIGRFFGPVRAVIPAVAGMLNMSPTSFFAVNVLSAIAWAPAYILPGVLFGTSLGLAAEVAGRMVLVILILVVMVLATVWLVHRGYLFFEARAERYLHGLYHWMRGHPFRERLITSVVDPAAPELKGLFYWALLLAFAVTLFSLLMVWVLQGKPLLLDQSLWQFLQGIRTPWADHLMVMITELGGGVVSLSMAAVVGLWLAWRRYWLALSHLVAAILFAVTVPVLLKVVLQLPRPVEFAEGALSYSFPSWHATTAAVLYGYLAIVISRELRHARWWVYGIAAVPILLIALSRLYLGVHWLSDVLGGLALGLAWVAILGIAYRRHAEVRIAWQQLVLVLLLAWGLIWPAYLAVNLPHHVARYQVPVEVEQASAVGWWQSGWQQLPMQRIDLKGSFAQRFNLQWLAGEGEIAKTLAEQGWHTPTQVGWKNALMWLAPDLKLSELPVLPQVHAGRHEMIAAIKEVADGRVLIIRLWQAPIEFGGEFTGTEDRLWFGYLAELVLYQPMDFFSAPRTGEVDDGAAMAFAQSLTAVSWRQEMLEQGKLILIRPFGRSDGEVR